MATIDGVVLAAHDAVQAELRSSRPNASPWRNKNMGPDDGAGYNYSNRTLRPFVKDCYAGMKRDPAMAGVHDRFGLPDRLPITDLLENNVTYLEQYIASDVCGQLGL